MGKYFYRFRSIKSLLDKHKELENQEIYFALPTELNDPMEGLRDLFWTGDRIIWENFIRHYLLCLEHACGLYVSPNNAIELKESNIEIFKTFDHFQDDSIKSLFNEICNECLDDENVSAYIGYLSKRKNKIRRNELIYHLGSLHYIFIDIIFKSYKKNRLINNLPIEFSKLIKTLNKKSISKLFANLESIESKYPDNPTIVETLYASQRERESQLTYISSYNHNKEGELNNREFIFIEFITAYVRRIEQLIYPAWYTACFMSECKNSSVWGHYGDKHKGVCLKFRSKKRYGKHCIELKSIKGLGKTGPLYDYTFHPFRRVNYKEVPVEIDFFRSLGQLTMPVIGKYWYSDQKGHTSVCADSFYSDYASWRSNHWDLFYKGLSIKAKDWRYEKEYRIISSNQGDRNSKESRKYKYKFNDLEGIIFGINTSKKDKFRIFQIIEKKCKAEGRSNFKFFQAYYDHKKKRINHTELSLLTFKS